MDNKSTILIPSTLQRLRCFMAAEGNLKVRPWAPVDETLDAFLRLLARNADEDRFWQGMKRLMFDISTDLKKRRRSERVTLDNEVLDSDTYDDLLAEIRGAVRERPVRRGAFTSCMSGLSAPAVALLFLMGGVATVGCADGVTDESDTSADTNTGGEGADSGTDEFGESDSDSEEAGDTGDTADGDTDFSGMSLTEIVQAVVPDAATASSITECIDSLDDSWESGLEELFQGEDEEEVLRQLNCLMSTGFCEDADAAGEYSFDTLLNNCAVAVYLGVHFE